MKRTRLRTPAGLTLAAILVIAAAFVGWLAVRTTALELLSGRVTPLTAMVADTPDVVLGTAMGRFAADRAQVRRSTLPAIRAAAARAPLDARPYLFIGSDELRSGQTARAVATLEAGRRLDPRQRWVHLLLFEQYLRAGAYPAAASELAVLARLVGGAQGPIAGALAQMIVAPDTRGAVQATLRQDANLERLVLASLAGSDVEPAVIFRMASPAAFATATRPDGWGTVLVDRLVRKRRYHLARVVWQRINRLSDQQVAPLLYDADLRQLPGRPPFNWQLASDSVAAVDVRGGKFNVTYYGRDSGDLASQLLLLPPGSYRFGYVVSGLTAGTGPGLAWSISCENRPDAPLANATLPATVGPRRVAFGVTVPADCPAQRLRLSGQASEFPTSVSAVIERLQLDRVATK